ncbi:MAG TPA: GFA family protein [Kofleriaceae bacterium]
MTTQPGSCHCGAVKFEAELELSFVTRCNCSICTKTMITGAMCKPPQFTLVAGEDSLSGYAWGGKVATRYFCKHCGIQCFGKGHLAELGGDFVSINVNCLDGVDVNVLPLRHWDGRHDNWGGGMRETPWPIYRAAS